MKNIIKNIKHEIKVAMFGFDLEGWVLATGCVVGLVAAIVTMVLGLVGVI